MDGLDASKSRLRSEALAHSWGDRAHLVPTLDGAEHSNLNGAPAFERFGGALVVAVSESEPQHLAQDQRKQLGRREIGGSQDHGEDLGCGNCTAVLHPRTK